MVDALAFVTEHGNMSAENLEMFTNKFCEAKSSTTTGQPRESIKLYDSEGNVIGRKCSGFKKWLPASEFWGDINTASNCKLATKQKEANTRDANKIVREAELLREEANKLDDPLEKLAKFEEFDAELERAKQIKSADLVVPKDYGFDTCEDLANDLGVECRTEKPTSAITDDPDVIDMAAE